MNQRTTISPTILIVDDEPMAREGLVLTLESGGYRLLEAGSGGEALGILGREPVDLVITDLKMPGMGGLDLIDEIRVNHHGLDVIVITGFATVDSAVAAVKKGALEYLTKPYDLEDVRTVVARSLRRVAASMDASGNRVIRPVIGESGSMRRVLALLEQVAPSQASVLVTGESGTGKELAARRIFELSTRRNNPFLSLNCASLSPSLLENELFGHEKGAFTDASSVKKGLFEAADGGTIFLDEIADIGPEMEVRLLRVLQEREVLRVGSTSPIAVDFRLIAATSRNLKSMVDGGTFRSDLYYRLNVIGIEMPPLRDRISDIPLLVDHFLDKYNQIEKKSVTHFEKRALQAMTTYRWPGNVRELENVIERAVILCRSREIGASELPPEIRQSPGQHDNLKTIQENEKAYIIHVLDQLDGNSTSAARVLGIDRTTLWRKLKAYGIRKD